MKHLPIDERGYPVPWFVVWLNGKPEFRVVKPGALELAWALNYCWVCGYSMNPSHEQPVRQTFVIGPMCVINRTSGEPGCHKECAVFSAMACPFLTKPQMDRRENNLPPEGEMHPAGIARNPGCVCVWTSDTATQFRDGTGGYLFNIGEPVTEPLWFAQGREATREQVLESVRTGVPILEGMAKEQGPDALTDLHHAIEEAERWWPK